MSPAQKDGKWFVEHRGQELAGALDSNAEAWRWIDRNEGEPISQAEKRAERIFAKSAGGRTMTADLQMTVAEASKIMGVSERLVYMARKISRLRPDLVPAIEAGELTLNKAMEMATGKGKPSSWDRLVKAWNAASDEERQRLVQHAMGDGT